MSVCGGVFGVPSLQAVDKLVSAQITIDGTSSEQRIEKASPYYLYSNEEVFFLSGPVCLVPQ